MFARFLSLAVASSLAITAHANGPVRTQIDAFEKAVRANTERIINAQTEEEKNRYRASIPSAAPFAAKVLDLIQKNPDTEDSTAGTAWLATQCINLPEGLAALKLLQGPFRDRSGLAPALRQMEVYPEDLVGEVLRTVRQHNPHLEERAAATYSLASQQMRLSETTTDPDLRAQAQKSAETWFQEIITEFANVRIQGFPLADLAAAKLYELTHLSVGATAPEITGPDLAGEKFNLSDFRDRHVLLVFWGDWCHGCHGLPRMLRELLGKLTPDSLTLLGVNTDPAHVAQEAIAKTELPWRCWVDGSTSGPITSVWSPPNFPTLYLVDPKGVILLKNAGLGEVETILQERLDPSPSKP